MSTVAIDVLPLVHMPPTDALENVVVFPMHTEAKPVMAAGAPFMVITPVEVHPAGEMYVMVEVPPATAVTSPAPSIVALLFEALQVPYSGKHVSAVLVPGYRADRPDIACAVSTDTTVVDKHEEGN